MDLKSSPLPIGSDPSLPPFHAVGEYVPETEYEPYLRSSVSNHYPGHIADYWDSLFPDPNPWIDNLTPMLGVSVVTGVVIGFWKGASKRGSQFTAENAHRKPRRVKAWYYYKRSKNFTILLHAGRTSLSYSFRLTSVLASFSLLSTTIAQSFAKAKTWRDEDRLARSLVRNYDGLGNARTEEEEKEWERLAKKAWEGEGGLVFGGKKWPNEDGFEVWDWVGGVGSGAAAGGIMAVGLGLYRHWYPPTLLLPALFAIAGGSFHGALNLYDARDRRQRRIDRKAVRDKLTKARDEEEAGRAWEEMERLKKEEMEGRCKEAEKKLQMQRAEEKREKGEWVGWVLAKMGGK